MTEAIQHVVIGTVIACVLALGACGIASVEEEPGYYRRITPRVVAAVALWPLTLVALVALGLWEWLPGKAIPDPRAQGEQLLSPAQRRELAFKREQLELHRAHNDEAERTTRIMNRELT